LQFDEQVDCWDAKQMAVLVGQRDGEAQAGAVAGGFVDEAGGVGPVGEVLAERADVPAEFVARAQAERQWSGDAGARSARHVTGRGGEAGSGKKLVNSAA